MSDDRTRELVETLRTNWKLLCNRCFHFNVDTFPVRGPMLAAADLIESQDAKLTAIREWLGTAYHSDLAKLRAIVRILDGDDQ